MEKRGRVPFNYLNYLRRSQVEVKSYNSLTITSHRCLTFRGLASGQSLHAYFYSIYVSFMYSFLHIIGFKGSGRPSSRRVSGFVGCVFIGFGLVSTQWPPHYRQLSSYKRCKSFWSSAFVY